MPRLDHLFMRRRWEAIGGIVRLEWVDGADMNHFHVLRVEVMDDESNARIARAICADHNENILS